MPRKDPSVATTNSIMARFLVRQSRSVQALPADEMLAERVPGYLVQFLAADCVEHRQRVEAKIADRYQLLELHPMLSVCRADVSSNAGRANASAWSPMYRL